MNTSEQYDILIQQSKLLKKALINIQIGAKSYEKNIPLEEKIIQLKEMSNFFDARIATAFSKIIENDEPNEKQSEESDKLMKKQLLDKAVNSLLEQKCCQTVKFSEKYHKLITNHYPKRPDYDLYKQQINEQLEIMMTNNEEISKAVAKQKALLENILYLQDEVQDTKEQFKNQLEQERAESMKKQNNLNTMYFTGLEHLKKRIKKLNFMRILTLRLLSHYNLDFTDDLILIMENKRTPITLETLKN